MQDLKKNPNNSYLVFKNLKKCQKKGCQIINL